MRAMTIGVLLALLVLSPACGRGQQEQADAPATTTESVPPREPVAEAVQAVARIEPKSGSSVTGTATFSAVGGQVTLTLEVQNAPPGEHAFHIHQVGDCSAPDGNSAGGHWNPDDVAHGRWGESPFHLGDVGNLTVGQDGYGSMTLTTDKWSIDTGAPNDILGKSVILHAKADDFSTQPTGAAGGRIGCGVIQ